MKMFIVLLIGNIRNDLHVKSYDKSSVNNFGSLLAGIKKIMEFAFLNPQFYRKVVFTYF